MRSPIRTGVLAAALLCGALALPAPPPSGQDRGDTGQVEVSLELSQQIYYEGDPLDLRVSVRNLGPEKISNPLEAPLFSGFRVRRAGGKAIKPAGSPRGEEPARPDVLAPAAFYGGVVNLVEVYPELAAKGQYEIHWSAGGLLANMLLVTVIPRYDPTRSYRADILTDLGSIEIDLLAEGAPIAVKAFVDLAHAGLYDGLRFQEVQADSYVGGGDPRFSDPPRRAISFPAEASALPLVAGTVVLRPMGAAPPANGPGFMITLRPQPAWAGQVTAFGQVIRGLDVVQKISRTPAAPRNAQTAGKAAAGRGDPERHDPREAGPRLIRAPIEPSAVVGPR